MQLVCKPDSVPVLLSAKEVKTGFHHLSCHDITIVIIRPTPRHRTSNPFKPVYMVFQPIRCTATDVTTSTGKLLPHLFTLTSMTLPKETDWRYAFCCTYPSACNKTYCLRVTKHTVLWCSDFPHSELIRNAIAHFPHSIVNFQITITV